MRNCDNELRRFYRQKVALPAAEQAKMKNRQGDILVRLNASLKKKKLPVPYRFELQGSFKMKTMLRDPNNEYDIDTGAYFHRKDLVSPNGQYMSVKQTKKMVCDALNGKQKDPRAHVEKNCVRVQYTDGSHLDIPVYRSYEKNNMTIYEYASEKKWKKSNAKDITNWYENVFKNKANQAQYRRLIHYLKKFAKSRKSCKSNNLSGFQITVLLAETAQFHPNRDDIALYNTMCRTYKRLCKKTVIINPLVSGQQITSDKPDKKVTNFKMCVKSAIDTLKPLHARNFDRTTALKRWDSVFNSDFFTKKAAKSKWR